MNLSDTIIAIASPPGRAPRGIVRISGVDTFALLALLVSPSPLGIGLRGEGIQFPSPVGRGVRDEGGLCNGSAQQARAVIKARLSIPSNNSSNLNLPVLLLTFPAPHSYTGEHAAELQLPGNPHLLERVVNHMLRSAREAQFPARLAEPGEFTARAFFNGRISLTQAEGVAATISAVSDAQLRAAATLRSGGLGDMARRLADRLADALALVEAGIDFTDEEDVVAIPPRELHARLAELRDDLARQLDHAVGFEQLQAIPWVVIAGPPNAGKSTLFNALLGRERAVVSDIAGTTRDVLAEPLHVATAHGDAEIMLVDLAGLDDADPSVLNRRMQQRARDAIDRAELILHCEAVDAPSETSRRPLAVSRGEPTIVLCTKADVHPRNVDRGRSDHRSRSLHVSAITGEGLAELRGAIAARLADRAVSLAADAMALHPRHQAAMAAALAHLNGALATLEPAVGERSLRDAELIASSMRNALDELSILAGDISPDDVLGRIFASFCVGK